MLLGKVREASAVNDEKGGGGGEGQAGGRRREATAEGVAEALRVGEDEAAVLPPEEGKKTTGSGVFVAVY